MQHRPRPPEQRDLLQPHLVDMIDGRHELVRLAVLIDWSWFEREWAGFFPAAEGQPDSHPRLVAGVMYPQHAHGAYSDETSHLIRAKGMAVPDVARNQPCRG